MVGPVEVLEPENQLLVERERLYEPRQLAQHSLRCRCATGVDERVPLVETDETRHLRQPRGRVASERVPDRLASRTSGEPLEGVEQRKIGVARPVRLHALTDGHPGRGALARRGEEALDKGRLADPRLAGDEQYLALTGPGLAQRHPELVALGVTAHEGVGATSGLGRRGLEDGPGRRLRGGIDRSDEPIPAPRARLEVPRPPRVVAQGSPDLLNAEPGHGLADRDAPPHAPQELRPTDEAARVLRQVAEHGEALGSNGDLALATPEAFAPEIETERGKNQHHPRVRPATGTPALYGAHTAIERGASAAPRFTGATVRGPVYGRRARSEIREGGHDDEWMARSPDAGGMGVASGSDDPSGRLHGVGGSLARRVSPSDGRGGDIRDSGDNVVPHAPRRRERHGLHRRHGIRLRMEGLGRARCQGLRADPGLVPSP